MNSLSGIGDADYFDEYVSRIPEEFAFRKTALPPDEQKAMQAYLLESPWLGQIQEQIASDGGPEISRPALLAELLQSPDYDYGGAWLAMGEDMLALDPGSNTYHGFSKTPGGRWLKSPSHETAWKEIFWNQAGFSPDTPYDRPHAPLTREEASAFLRRNQKRGQN